MATGPDATATFCSTLVDEWVRCGVAHAVIAPGSRSTPLALALADAASRARLSVHVHHDERCASFLALGIGLATGRPAVLLCTSGTAAAHFHAAVIEAHQASVPLVVCTADRPPELRDVGAPQTIDQTRLYGTAVRWFHDPGVPDDATAGVWRSLAARSFAEARGLRPGPVHLNLPFREPLLGAAGPLPPGRPDERPWHGATPVDEMSIEVDVELRSILDRGRGLIVAGEGCGAEVHELARHLGWPVLADPRSGARIPAETTVAAFDALLRNERFAADHRPEVVLRFGAPPASKVLDQWLTASGADVVVVDPSGAWLDPGHRSAFVVRGTVGTLQVATASISAGRDTPWSARWRHAEAIAQRAIHEALDREAFPSEPAIARSLVAGVPNGSILVASSSMPIRDVEWFAEPRAGLRVLANRGANGIDGVVSTAIGAAAGSGGPVALLIGDVAFLHDSNALIGLAERDVDLLVVVVDNRGGGIFEFLPQASGVGRDRFELLFGTPHDVDIEMIARAHAVATATVESPGDLAEAIAAKGVRIAVVRTDRRSNVEVHNRLNAAVSVALDHGVR